MTCLVSSLICACLLQCAHAGAGTTTGYAALVHKVAPSVVTVLIEERAEGAAQRAADRALARNQDDDVRSIMRRMLAAPGASPGPGGAKSALGSGFIVRSDGLIVTNRHVVVGARIMRVKLSDGRVVAAKLLGADPTTDVALLKVDAGALPALHLESSDKVSVGDPVVAIGNPFGLGQTVTAGILSARARVLDADPFVDFLQTDAAINFGNSGGPLLSIDGTVIGVTTAIFSPSGGSVGLGFAIPAEVVSEVITELEAHGRVDRGYLGIEVQAMTPALARALLGRDKASGALITNVDPQGPSAGALSTGDVLESIGSIRVTFLGLRKISVRLKPGSIVQATVMRDGMEQTLGVTVGQMPDPPEDPLLTGSADTWAPNLELGVAETTPDIRKALKAPDEVGGLIVTQLRPDGVGALAGLRVGDLITHAGSKHLDSVADLAMVDKPSPQVPLLLRVFRNGNPSFVALTGAEPDFEEPVH